MSAQEHIAVIFTPSHSITGTLTKRDQRLSDVLNDMRESAVHLRNVKVSRHNDPGKILAEHVLSLVPKELIAIAFEPGSREPPSSKRLYSYVKKQQQEIFMLLDGFEVGGVIHILGNIDPLDIHALIATQKERFLPVTNALVTFASDERYLVKRDAIIVNLQRINYIAKAGV